MVGDVDAACNQHPLPEPKRGEAAERTQFPAILVPSPITSAISPVWAVERLQPRAGPDQNPAADGDPPLASESGRRLDHASGAERVERARDREGEYLAPDSHTGPIGPEERSAGYRSRARHLSMVRLRSPVLAPRSAGLGRPIASSFSRRRPVTLDRGRRPRWRAAAEVAGGSTRRRPPRLSLITSTSVLT